MSSGSRYGYACRIRSRDLPPASSPRMVPTVTRSPRMQGSPPMTAGLWVIRSIGMTRLVVDPGLGPPAFYAPPLGGAEVELGGANGPRLRHRLARYPRQ